MAAFIDLEDSPLFHKQRDKGTVLHVEACKEVWYCGEIVSSGSVVKEVISSLEQTADELKDRCQKLYKGCKIFMASLGEACYGDNVFAESLESFGGGRDDPDRREITNSEIWKHRQSRNEAGRSTYPSFTMREVPLTQNWLSQYKNDITMPYCQNHPVTCISELLPVTSRLPIPSTSLSAKVWYCQNSPKKPGSYQVLTKDYHIKVVEHVLVDRVTQFMSVELQGAKDSRQRFNKSIHAYDQAREKFVSLKKGTREDVIAGVEEDLLNSKSTFDRSRFNLVNALMAVEAKKKYEFLESFSAIMDAHLRYFKLGYELLKEMEPLIHEELRACLGFQSLIIQIDSYCHVLTCAQQYKELASAKQDNLARKIQEFRTEAEMNSLKSSGNLVASGNVDSIHTADANSYKGIKAIMLSAADGEVHTIKQGYLFKQSSNLRGDWKRRFFVLDSHGTLNYYGNKGPKSTGSFSHQSIGAADRNGVFGRFKTKHGRTSSWSEESQGCHTVDLRTSIIKIDAEDKDLRLCFRIISPLKSFTLQAESEAERMDWVNKIAGVITSLLNSHLIDQEPGLQVNEKTGNDTLCDIQSVHRRTKSSNDVQKKTDGVSVILRKIPGNDRCAECDSPEPDWASLNLGILFCIQCSSAHRNLGVHVSKVRSVTLDVKVWESTIIDLFRALGNDYCNSVWEAQLSVENGRVLESDGLAEQIVKPSAHDTFQHKEKYIQMKYLEKRLVSRKAGHNYSSCAEAIWEAVKTSDIRGAYSIIAASDTTILNTTFEEIHGAGSKSDGHGPRNESHALDPATCPIQLNPGDPDSCLRRCSILHLACDVGDPLMVELLLQFGADINMRDFHGRTPLHLCIAKKKNKLAKYLLRRGAHRLIKDWGGLTALERAMELGSITDEELFILLAENQ
ncbi:hypothetical protein V2J09_005962 [Rumex salicifolius]